MIAWIECAGRLPYLAAIVGSVEEAERIKAELPADVSESSRIRVRNELAWPCFVVEGPDGFAFCSAAEAAERISAYLRSESLDDEDRRVTVYRVVHSFLPEVAGRDEMGRLPHTHPGASEAVVVAVGGIEALWNS